MFRIYYHLYLGPSWRSVWALHAPLLKRFAGSGRLDKLVVCTCGSDLNDGEIVEDDRVELRRLLSATSGVNEFHTLQQMHHDACDASQVFDHCVYLHSKGSSSRPLQQAGAEWSSFLATALIGALHGFDAVVARGYNSIGSNLAFGIFEDFAPPRLHYSGNFWCVTRGLVATLPRIVLGERHAAVRHNAEWWLDRAAGLVPFNVFSTGIDHYSALPGVIDWARLEARLESFAHDIGPAERQLDKLSFLCRMIESATGSQTLRRILSETLLRLLPHHRRSRLLNLHDLIMRTIGSRKSAYFYCAES